MPIKVRVIREKKLSSQVDNENNIDVYFVKIFNLRFDLDRFMKKAIGYDEKKKLSLQTIFDNSVLLKKNKKLISSLLGLILIRKITITYNVSNVILGVAAWNSIYFIRNKLIELTLNLDNEYYNVKYNNMNNVNFEIIFYIRIIYIIYAYIKNINDYIKIKRKGSALNVRTSN